jgi:hypothetical protein
MSQVGSAFKRIGGTVSRAISNVPVIGPTVSSIGSAAFGVVAGGIDALTGGIFGLTPQQKLPDLSLNFSSFGSTAQGRLVAVKQAIMTRQVIYGTRRIAGNLIYAETTGSTNTFLHLIYAVAGHEIDSFVSFKINEDDVTLDTDGFVQESKYISGSEKMVRIKYHTGTDTQTADSDLVSESNNLWTNEHKLSGIAYFYARLKFDSTVFPNGIPNITTIVRGKKVFDPRTSTTTYSSNSALCVRDYLLNSRFGLNANSSEINDTSFSAGANSCDEDVTLATPISKTFNASTDVSSSNETITILGHELETGYAVTYSNEGGTNISGLSNSTVYYVIRVDNDTIKLATSSSNATSGTAINITVGSSETQALKRLVEKRYECHGILDTGQTPGKILTQMTSSCIGLVYYSGGKWSIKVGEYISPTITLDEDDLAGPITLGTRNSRRDSFNAVKGIFSNPNENYQPTDFPSITSSTFEVEDNNERIFRDIELAFTTSPSMAQRIAKIVLFRNRQQMTMTVPVKLTGFNVEVGDTIQITNSRFGFSAKTFEVANWHFESGSDGILIIKLVLKEISSAVYDWSAEESDIISNNTTLPDIFDVSPPGITASDELRAFNQEAVSVLIVDVSSSDAFVTDFEVEAKQSTASEYVSLGKSSTNRYELVNVEDGVTYDVRARAVTTLGSKSDVSSTTHQVVGKTAPPSDVTNFSVNVIDDVAHLTWTPVSDLDLSHYKIRHTVERSNPRYVAAQTVVDKVARPAQSVTVPAMTGTYFCKAVDKLGNLSETPASTQVLIGDTIFNQVNTVETITENPSFSGAKSNVVATTDNTLILDTSTNFDSVAGNFDDATGNFDGGGGNVSSQGTYDFATKTDLGAKFRTRVNYTLTVDRVEYVTSFDDATGNFDDREGNFDGDVNAFDTTDVEMQIATTDDDPASGSASFTTFRPFIAGEYEGRGFKYRIVLTTSDSQASPTVSALAVKVEMIDRRLAEGDIASGTDSGGKVVSYSNAFKVLESLQVTGQNLNSGDTYVISNKSATGFTIKFLDSGSSVVNRTFDYVATGYGIQLS